MKLIPGFLLGVVFILIYKFGITGLISNELSFTMNGVEPRYVDTFRYTEIYRLPSIRNQNFETSGDQYLDKLRLMESKISSILSGVPIRENIVIYISNLGNYTVFVSTTGGKITFEKVLPENLVPTIVLSLNTMDIDGLEQFLSDDILDQAEKLKIADVVMGPMIERMYRLSRFYKVNHMSKFGFDDFMQFEITGGENIDRAGTPINLRYTILNVDGQWIVKNGFTGDPDVRFSMTIDEAGRLYKKLASDLEESQNKVDALKHSTDIFEILKNNITYIRDDHK